MKARRNDPCPCGSGKKYKKCCLLAPSARAVPVDQSSSIRQNAVLFKPVQFFGVVPVMPTPKPGLRGAIAQFVIPGLHIAGRDRSGFAKFALACDEAVETASFHPVTADRDKQPGTLASLTFHYVPDPDEEAHKPAADRIGRLITEKFVGLLSFVAGQRVLAVHQQVSELNDDGSLKVRLHPHSRGAAAARRIKIPDSLSEKPPSKECFKALFWLRRGLTDHDQLDAYAALMVTLQIVASILMPKETTANQCKKCGEPYETLTRPSVKRLVVEKLGGDLKLIRRIWKVRNNIVAHGEQEVTADVLQDVVELKLDAIDLAFKGVKLAMGLPVDGPPRPSQVVMTTDPFLGAE